MNTQSTRPLLSMVQAWKDHRRSKPSTPKVQRRQWRRKPRSKGKKAASNRSTSQWARKDRSKSRGASDGSGWESDSSGGSFGKHRAKTYGKLPYVALIVRHDAAVRDWLRRLDSAQEDPYTTWSTMNPRASIELNNAAWEDSPYGCRRRHRMRIAGAVDCIKLTFSRHSEEISQHEKKSPLLVSMSGSSQLVVST